MESHGNAPITLNFNDGQTVQVTSEFWTKNNLDRFDSVRAVKYGKLINFYGDFLSAEEKKNLPKETKEVQTEFDVIITSYGTSKLAIVRAVKEITGLGLKESMLLVTTLPGTIKEKISSDEANSLKERLETEGATIELK